MVSVGVDGDCLGEEGGARDGEGREGGERTGARFKEVHLKMS